MKTFFGKQAPRLRSRKAVLQSTLPALLLFSFASASADFSLLTSFPLEVNAGTVSRSSSSRFHETQNAQSVPLLNPAKNTNPHPLKGGGNIVIVDDRALLGTGGASEVVFPDTHEETNGSEISVYVVREGDTISQIADMFGVTGNTIRWANQISSDEFIHEGQALVILPIPGVQYTVESGDTLASIAEEFQADVAEIEHYNRVSSNEELRVGSEIIIPHGEVVRERSNSSSESEKSSSPSVSSSKSSGGYFIAPLSNYVETQGIHGYNAVDLAAPYGSTIYAAASGEVIVRRGGGGWNGGYGNYVVIKHPNGTQTLYAHMSSIIVGSGHVVRGQVIGYVGSTGHSTGPHLHFEVRGGTNPF